MGRCAFSVLYLKFAQQIRPVPEGRNVYSTAIPKNSEAPEERNIWFRVTHLSLLRSWNVSFGFRFYKHCVPPGLKTGARPIHCYENFRDRTLAAVHVYQGKSLNIKSKEN
jgi:hypothetical protein